MTRPKRTRWGEGRLEMLTKLWLEDVPVENIAEVFGMHAEAIRAAARHYGLPRRSRGRKKGYVTHRPKLEHKPTVAMPALLCAPGWPTKAQLMGRR